MLLSFGCAKDDGPFIADQLQPYVDDFILEASLRDKAIDLLDTPIEAKFQNIAAFSVAGQCKHNANNPSLVIIDVSIWEQADALEKEYIMFHELGHCILNRGHLEDRDLDNNCVSIMQSGTTGCKINYSESTRSSYLDELFR